MPKPEVRQVKLQGVQDMAALMELLKIPVDRRTQADEVLIANQIRYTGIFEQLYISPNQESALCRILHIRKFLTKGATVVHEGQSKGSFYLLLEGTLVVLASRRSALQSEAEHKSKTEKYVLIVNIVEALSLAAADKSGTSDPFVTVACGTKEEKTSVKKETLNPIWDERVRISDIDTSVEHIDVAVWDYDTWGEPDFLGIAIVPLAPLMENLHEVQNFGCRLRDDARYQAAADEAGVHYDISGSISFTVQVTTEAVLAQIETLMEGEQKAGKQKTYLTAGDSFGHEQVLQSNGTAGNSVIVEQPTIALRVMAGEQPGFLASAASAALKECLRLPPLRNSDMRVDRGFR